MPFDMTRPRSNMDVVLAKFIGYMRADVEYAPSEEDIEGFRSYVRGLGFEGLIELIQQDMDRNDLSDLPAPRVMPIEQLPVSKTA